MTMPSHDQRLIPFPVRPEADAAAAVVREPEMLTFEEALGTVLDPLYRVALRLCASAEDAEDVVQETALRAFRCFHQLRSHGDFRPWLFAILRRTALNHRRGAARRPVIEDIDLEQLVAADAGAGWTLPSSLRAEDLHQALEALPDIFQQVVWLVDVEGFTLAESATILDIPPGTAASRLSRAHGRLRERLAGHEGDRP